MLIKNKNSRDIQTGGGEEKEKDAQIPHLPGASILHFIFTQENKGTVDVHGNHVGKGQKLGQ